MALALQQYRWTDKQKSTEGEKWECAPCASLVWDEVRHKLPEKVGDKLTLGNEWG